MKRNTLTMSVRLPDVLLANVAYYLSAEQNFVFTSKSELVREALYAFEELLKTIKKDEYKEFSSTVDARKFLESISGTRFTGNRNKCSFEEQAIFEETGLKRINQKSLRGPLETFKNNGDFKNALNEKQVDPSIVKIANEIDQADKLKNTMNETVRMVLNKAIPMPPEDRVSFLLKNSEMTEEEIKEFDRE